jgi:peptidoglycan-N-acetylglucosamine deacetylase
VLADLRISATFFLIGREAEKYPAVVRRIAAEGHVVGNHTYSHSVRELLSAGDAAAEFRRGAEAIANTLGQPPTLFRPPRGKITTRDLYRLWRAKITTVLWNKDPKDYNKTSVDEVREWFKRRSLEGGDLVLFHDNHLHAVKILPDLVRSGKERDLSFVTVETWLK